MVTRTKAKTRAGSWRAVAWCGVIGCISGCGEGSREARQPVARASQALQAALPDKLQPDSPVTANQLLGFSVAVSGTIAAVGAPQDPGGGSAYVYEFDGAHWVKVIPRLHVAPASATLGSAVAVTGQALLVGAGMEPSQGAVYVFRRAQSGQTISWNLSQPKILGETASSQFGAAIAVAADRAIVGAPHGTTGGISDSGAAYIYERSPAGDPAGLWSLAMSAGVSIGKLSVSPSTLATGDQFGASVAIDGDFALVGAPFDGGAAHLGAAYVFRRQDNGAAAASWVREAKLTAAPDGATADRQTNDEFGQALALIGDLAVVTAPRNNPIAGAAANEQGTAHVFKRQVVNGIPTWSQIQKFTGTENGPGDRFGNSASLSGPRLLIGASFDNATVSGGGAGYVFQRAGDTWSQKLRLTVPGSIARRFGGSVALSGLNAIIGAPVDQSSAPATPVGVVGGAAYAYGLLGSVGEPCGQASECGSGFCVDGVCCASACTPPNSATCSACSVAFGAAVDGTCAIVNDANHDGVADCDPVSACTRSGAGFTCTCPPGFTDSNGNGTLCSDIDECASGTVTCPIGQTCVNTPGSYTCSCPENSTCNDGNACTQTDICQNGACVGTNPVLCTPLDQCHAPGTCNPASGVCSNPNQVDGSACSDANACTQNDVCQAGVCTAGAPVACPAPDQCHEPGACDPGSGLCSNPSRPNGSACSADDDVCTQDDTCQAGVCTAGAPVICPLPDQCHDPGTCHPGTGLCSNPSKPNGSACNADNSACTQNDLCQAGVCTAGTPVACPTPDQCHDLGLCSPATGLCSNPSKPNGSACNADNSACTQSDVCQGGVCTAGTEVACPAPDQCHDPGICNPSTGVCSNPNKPNGSPCNDVNACTQTDSCQAGACVGASPAVCTALDQCHNAGTCNPATGVCSNPNKPDGTTCNDADVCTAPDTCTNGACSGPILDSDNDGTPNCSDGCPNDPNKTSPGLCGCGVSDSVSFTLPNPGFAVACRESEPIAVGQASATTACGQVQTVTGQVIATNGVTLATPIPITAGNAQLGVGTHTIRWTAMPANVTADQNRFVGSVIQAGGSFTLGDRARLRDSLNDVDNVPAGTFQGRAVLLNSGTGIATVSADARAGGIRSLGSVAAGVDVNLLVRAIIQGSVVTRGTIATAGPGDAPTITGLLLPNTPVVLPNLPSLPTFPTSFAMLNPINSGAQVNLAPGAYQSLSVASGGTVVLSAGQYFFQNINVQGLVRAPAAVMTAGQPSAGPRVYVQSSFALLNPIRVTNPADNTTVQTAFIGLATSGSATLQVPFNGTLVAPNTSVTVGTGGGVTFTGAIYGRALGLSNDSRLVCSRPSAALTTPPQL